MLRLSDERERRFALLHEEPGIGAQRSAKAFRRTFSDRCVVRPHYHETVELNLSDGVAGAAMIEGERYELGRSPLLVIPPRTVHSYDIGPCAGSMLVVHVSCAALAAWLNRAEVEGSFARLPRTDSGWSGSCEEVRRFAEAWARPEHQDDCLVAAQVLALLAALAGSVAGNPVAAARANPRSRRDGEDLDALVALAAGRLSRPPSIEEAARKVSKSRSAFCRWFKERTGMGFGEFVEELRLEEARKRLEEAGSVAAAAETAGYEDASYFVKRFKLRYGVTPGRWTRRERSGD
jgi:AraC-like DNA-binding protein